jgi:dTDP-4-dehydrorhamnose 3,5-epimerase
VRVTATTLPGVLIVERSVFADARGSFFESYSLERYTAAGISMQFVQDNVSFSTRNVLRGLHFQHPHAQAKLVEVLHGEVFDVVVDVRRASPTFGRWLGTTLSSANKRQLFVPRGFAHGFAVTSSEAVFAYKCTEYYRPASERVIRWNDPALAIEWPSAEVIASDRDRVAPALAEIPAEHLPPFE